MQKLKKYINSQNPRVIYSVILAFWLFHFLFNYHNILIESDLYKYYEGRIAFLLIFVIIAQLILLKKQIRILLKYCVLFYYIKPILRVYSILNNQTDYFERHNSTRLIVVFSILTFITWIFYIVLENTKDKTPAPNRR